MAINTSNDKVRIISTTISGLATNSKFSDINSPALVVNTTEGGVFYTSGNSSTLTQLAALPTHSHSNYSPTDHTHRILPELHIENNTLSLTNSGTFWIGIDTDDGQLFRTDKGWYNSYRILDSNNYTTYCSSIGHIHSNYVTIDTNIFEKIYTFNTHNTYKKLGTINLPQLGTSIKIQLITGSGYNGEAYQEIYQTIILRSSNGNANSKGEYAAGYNYVYSDNNYYNIYIKQLSSDKFEIWAGLINYSGDSMIKVSCSRYVSFEYSSTTSSTVPDYTFVLPVKILSYSGHTHNYLPLSGGTVNGNLRVDGTSSFYAKSGGGTYFDGDSEGGGRVIMIMDPTNPLGSGMDYLMMEKYLSGHANISNENGVLALQTNQFNVGIGTAYPGEKLEVNGNIKVGNVILSSAIQAGGVNMFTMNDSYANFGSKWYNTIVNGATTTFNIGDSTSMYIGTNGNVAIGGTTADEKLHVHGNVKATKFIGSLQGNADSANLAVRADNATNADVAYRLTSPYAYEDGNTLSIDTAAANLFPDSYSFSAIMTSDDSLFGKGYYANVWNFSGYQRYGGTQFAVSYNEGSRAAIRTYTQSTSSWSPWYHLVFQHDLANYIPKSDKFIPNAVTTCDYPNNQERVATLNFLSHWNGAHSYTYSNLQYCDRGRFGTIVTKNSGDYAAAGHTHAGLVGDIITFTKSLNVTTSWQDTGISYNNIPETGTYIIQLIADLSGTAGQWAEFYSGVMSWYAGGTNDSNADEIFLHKAGHATNGESLFLRTSRHPGGELSLQISSTTNFGVEKNLTFKFRKMI